MAVLKNDVPIEIIKGGDYIFKPSGALDVQVEIDGEGFDTIPDGSLTAADSGIVVRLSPCQLQITNAGAETLVIKRVTA